ncbi:unnamed protein product [Parascedosporium putredinis]|uniref:Nephrocystin 3-like N-terminal domain-containing protein n=1 Tax=Parascedosporium putredinis TaxID=1442378 RepID=A0A9P1GZM9_9PEZI|nr:unnamed protein product [Parascedosporium putredinis]CAI7993054.1 unnamed protein product [Parascedosporium putredinis]
MSSSESRTSPFAVSGASTEAAEKCAASLPEEVWLKFRNSEPEDIIYDMERMKGTYHQTEELICFIRRVQLVTEPVEWFSSQGLSPRTVKSSSPIWGLVRLALDTAGAPGDRRIKREARLANMIESEDPNPEASWERRVSEEYLNTAGKMNNTMAPFQQRHDLALRHIGNWLGVQDCDTDIDRFRLQPHTTDWVLQHPEVVRWKRERKTQLLWISGPPGCGKTHAYVKLLRNMSGDGEDAMRFFFDRSDNSRTLTDALLRTWIYQLVAMSCSHSSQAMRLAWARQRIGATRVATKEQVRDLFTSLLKVVVVCCFTADGIDECADRVELRKILDIIPATASLTMTPDLFGKSLGRYIRDQLNDLPGDRSAEQLGCIQGCLEGPHATFLGVRLAMQRLRRSNAEEDTVVEMVKNLSDDVNDIYDEILAEVDASPHGAQQMAYAVFFWILSARRLLTLDELLSLLAVRLSGSAGEDEDNDESAYYVPIHSENPQELIESITGGLVVCGDQRQAVCFTHSTAAERLNKQRVLSMAAEYHEAPPLFPHDSIATAVCMRYLSLNILATEASPTGSGLELTDVVRLSSPASGVLGALVYAAGHWFLHARKAGDMDATTLRIGARFLDGGRPNMELSWRVYWFAHGGIHPGAQLPRGFSSLHVTTYFDLYALFLHLLPDVPATSVDSNGASVVWWAASLGRDQFVEQLLEHGADPQQPDAAVAAGHRSSFADIWEPPQAQMTVDPPRAWDDIRNDRTDRGRTVVHLAALHRGRSGTLSDLIQVGNCDSNRLPIVDRVDNAGQTALHLAACHDWEVMVRHLQLLGADGAIQDAAGKNAYHRATEGGCTRAAAALAERSALDRLLGRYESTINGQRRALGMERAWNLKLRMFKVPGSAKAAAGEVQDEYEDHADFCGGLKRDRGCPARGRGRGHSPLATDSSGRTILHHSIIMQEDDLMSAMLNSLAIEEKEFRALLGAQDDRGWTALHYAALGQSPDVIETLVSAGAPTDTRGIKTRRRAGELAQRDRFGRVPAFRAAEARRWDVLQILCPETKLAPRDILSIVGVLATSKCTAPDLFPMLLERLPPFCLAHAGMHAHGLAQLLLVGNATINGGSAMTEASPLLVALEAGDWGVATFLVRCGADVNWPRDRRPILAAVKHGGPECVEMLLRHGAKAHHVFRDSVPAPKMLLPDDGRGDGSSCPAESKHIVRVLTKYGAPIFRGPFPRGGLQLLVAPDNHGNAPIHVAILAGDVEAVQMELDAGVPVDWASFGFGKKTPLRLAVERDDMGVTALLLRYGANPGELLDREPDDFMDPLSQEMRELLERSRTPRELL